MPAQFALLCTHILLWLSTVHAHYYVYIDPTLLYNVVHTLKWLIFNTTHTNFDFSSHHPLPYKIAVVRTLYSRAQALMSSAVTRTQEQHTISKALAQNGYPATFIHCHSQPSQDSPSLSQPSNATTSATIPLIKGTTEAIRRVLSPLGIRTTFRPINTLRQLLVHPKDHVPQQERPGVVYRIPCTNCSRTYIGQTGRPQRLKEHRRAVRNADTATSALAEHVHSTGHPVNWTEARVIDTCSYTSRRCLLESWMIHKETNHLNRELGTLPHIYKTLIKHS